MDPTLKALHQERHKGARYCATLAIKALREAKDPVEVAGELLRVKPEMAPIVQIAVRCIRHFEQGGSPADWEKELQGIERELKEGSQKIAQWMAEQETGNRILTISYSDTVFQALVEAAKIRNLTVCITEGRPGYEGRLLAKRLAAAGIAVTLGVDGATFHLLETCDAVWVGADAVGEEYFVNKIGTKALVLGAKVMQKPVYLVADPLKKWPKGREWAESKRDVSEVLGGAEPPLTVVNPYFERTPLEWVQQPPLS